MTILKDDLKQGLHDLQDYNSQKSVWNYQVDDPNLMIGEILCQTFDDTGLNYAFETGEAEQILGIKSYKALSNLSQAIDATDILMPLPELLNHPDMENIRHLARVALQALDESEHTTSRRAE